MDTKTVPRHFAYLVAVIILLLVSRSAHAQSGTCPDNTTQHGNLPAGTYPPGVLCDAGGHSQVVYNPMLPCGSGVEIDVPIFGEPGVFYIVPSAGYMYPSGVANFRAFVGAYFVNSPVRSDLELRFVSYDSAGVQLEQKIISTVGYTAYDAPGGHFWYLDFSISLTTGGYLTVMSYDLPLAATRWSIANMVLVDSGGWSPPTCTVPGMPTATPTTIPTNTPTPSTTPTPPNTPTPSDTPGAMTPSATAAPTGTPTNTPIIPPSITPTSTPPLPTVDNPGTLTPLPTNTPYQIVTAPVPPSPTQMNAPQLPVPVFPTVHIGSVERIGTPLPLDIQLTIDATTEAQLGAVGTSVVQIEAVATDWADSINEAMANLSVSNTQGISTPIEYANTIAENISEPFSYVRAIKVLAPNMWGIIFFTIIATAWVVFVLVTKTSLAVVTDAVGAIKGLVQLIAGFFVGGG